MVRIDAHVHAWSDDPSTHPYCDTMGLASPDPNHHTATDWSGPSPGEAQDGTARLLRAAQLTAEVDGALIVQVLPFKFLPQGSFPVALVIIYGM